MDAKSAMRFIRKHADEFQIDPDKIIASGGSAGGHLAAATALIDGYNDPSDDLSISSKPSALVLLTPSSTMVRGDMDLNGLEMPIKIFLPSTISKKGLLQRSFFLGQMMI